MSRFLCLILLLGAMIVSPAASQTPDSTAPTIGGFEVSSFRVVTGQGRPATLEDITAAMADVDVVFIGEEHNDPVAHELQVDLLLNAYRAYNSERRVALSMEMFSRDVQGIINEYLADLVTEQHFRKDARPWQNYETDYRPLVEFAKAHRLPVIAANAPRRYVNRVSRLGPDALRQLTPQARAALAPLPYPGPTEAYREKWDALMSSMGAEHGQDPDEEGAEMDSDTDDVVNTPEDLDSPAVTELPEGHPEVEAEDAAPGGMHSMAYLLDAQALWDATMAYSISEYLEQQPNALVLHMAGAFHVEGGLGTPEALQHYRPGTRSLVVVIRPFDDLRNEDGSPVRVGGMGDFVILTDSSRPRSF